MHKINQLLLLTEYENVLRYLFNLWSMYENWIDKVGQCDVFFSLQC